MKEWEKIEEQLRTKAGGGAKRKLLDAINYYGQEVEMDAQGRLLLPQKLREKGEHHRRGGRAGAADVLSGCECRES